MHTCRIDTVIFIGYVRAHDMVRGWVRGCVRTCVGAWVFNCPHSTKNKADRPAVGEVAEERPLVELLGRHALHKALAVRLVA